MKSPVDKIVVLAEFNSPASLIRAAEKLKNSQFKKFDCHSPFPIHGMDDAMGLKPSVLGYIAGLMALIGLVGALLLQWWTSSVEYPLVISGKPFFSYQAFLPVTFAGAVLLAAFGSILGMLALNQLPRFNHPIFTSKRFKKVTDDGFFVSIELPKSGAEIPAAENLLASLGGSHIEVLDGR